MTSQTPGGRSIHWAMENSLRARPYTRFLLRLLMMSTHPRPTRELARMAGSERGRRRVRSAKGNQSITPPSLFPFLPIPYPFLRLLHWLQRCWYQVPQWSATDELARLNVLLILLSMFASILFVIAVSFVSSALSLLYVLVLSLSFFSGPRIVACSGVIQATWRSL